MPVPAKPRIYHIVHVDRLNSIVADGCLWSDSETTRRGVPGTTIGMQTIKQRRRRRSLHSYPHLNVGDCVPFYFCPRSVMLYVIHMANNPELSYKGGQGPIVHLEADLHEVVSWADQNSLRWAFTTSYAGSNYFEDYANLTDLPRVNWSAVHARDWRSCHSEKQAEFLIERSFPWELVARIGVHNWDVRTQTQAIVAVAPYQPRVEIIPRWYY